MANIREIQSRINSVKDTMKITNAMYMISSSKMTQAKKMLSDVEPYFYALQNEIERVMRHTPDMEHCYYDKREKIAQEDRRVGIILVTGDKGLAGAYNHNVIKRTEELLAKPGHHELFIVGEMGRQYFAKRDVEIDTNFRYTIQKPTMHRCRDIADEIIDQFVKGEMDDVYIIYTRMENSMQSVAECMKLLPLERKVPPEAARITGVMQETIEMYPSPEAIISSIVPSLVSGTIYGCLVEAMASEHNARMMAMKSATDSAESLIKELSILYNRARQAAITQEITEVCSGARAQQRG